MSNFLERSVTCEGVRFDDISVTRGWVGVQFPGKKCYVTLECPLMLEINDIVLYYTHAPSDFRYNAMNP